MSENSLKKILPVCLNCGRHCPTDQISCTRGKDFLAGYLFTMSVLNPAIADGIELTCCPLCKKHCPADNLQCDKGNFLSISPSVKD